MEYFRFLLEIENKSCLPGRFRESYRVNPACPVEFCEANPERDSIRVNPVRYISLSGMAG